MDDEKQLQDQCIETIKNNITSVSFNQVSNSYEVTISNSQLIEILYDINSIKLSIRSSVIPNKNNKENLQTTNETIIKDNQIDNKDKIHKKNVKKQSNVNKADGKKKKNKNKNKKIKPKDTTITATDNNKSKDDNKDDIKASNNVKKGIKKKNKKRKSKNLNIKDVIIVGDDYKNDIDDIKPLDININKKRRNLTKKRRHSHKIKALKDVKKDKKKKKIKHQRQKSKTTDDLPSFSSFKMMQPQLLVNDAKKDKNKKKKKSLKRKVGKYSKNRVKDDTFKWHPKFTYFSTERKHLSCIGSADDKCRYKEAGSMKFGSTEKRKDMLQFRVPLSHQVVYAYCVEDLIGDGTNGDISKVEGGEFKEYVRVFVHSQWGHGVNVKLHVWYKNK